MKRYVLHEPFNIYEFDASEWQHPVHTHTYFELIFIVNGKGKHHINGNDFPYSKGDVFLLGPEDYHHFEISRLTRFCYIRFQNSFGAQLNKRSKTNSFRQVMETLFSGGYRSNGPMIRNSDDQEKLQHLLAVLRMEYHHLHQPYFELLRDNLMESILAIIMRHFSPLNDLNKKTASSKLEDILVYIRQNIYDPSKLGIEHLADKFHYAPSYLSIYFKDQTGESLKQFIIRQKIKLIEARLLYSRNSLAEIAHEFSFSDESHLIKIFKKYNRITPARFRQRR